MEIHRLCSPLLPTSCADSPHSLRASLHLLQRFLLAIANYRQLSIAYMVEHSIIYTRQSARQQAKRNQHLLSIVQQRQIQSQADDPILQ